MIMTNFEFDFLEAKLSGKVSHYFQNQKPRWFTIFVNFIINDNLNSRVETSYLALKLDLCALMPLSIIHLHPY